MSKPYTKYTVEEVKKILEQYRHIFEGGQDELKPYWDIESVNEQGLQDSLLKDEQLKAYSISSNFLENDFRKYKESNEKFEQFIKDNSITYSNRCYELPNENLLDNFKSFTSKEGSQINSAIGFNPLCDNLLLHSSETAKDIVVILAHDWYPLVTGKSDKVYMNYLPPSCQDCYQEHRYYRPFHFFPDEELIKKYRWLYLNVYPFFRKECSNSRGAIGKTCFYKHWGCCLKKMLGKTVRNGFKIIRIIVWGKLPAYSLLSKNKRLNKWVEEGQSKTIEAKDIMLSLNYRYGNMDFEQTVRINDTEIPIFLAYHPSYGRAKSDYQKGKYKAMLKKLL